MAVYTKVTDEQAREFVSNYDIGEYIRIAPIQGGIENTNYHLFTDIGRYILTLYEQRVDVSDLPFFFDFTDHLIANGIVCPETLKNRDGNRVGNVAGKSAAIISFLDGYEIEKSEIDDEVCFQLGKSVAKMHVASSSFLKTRENSMGRKQWNELFSKVRDKANEVSDGLERFIVDEQEYLNNNHPGKIPSCVVHADMFPDNVFFKDNNLYGFIDFYYSCNGSMIYDLLITINAWCFDECDVFVNSRFRSVIKGYQEIRKLDDVEYGAIYYMSRAASMRFLVTRLYDWVNTPADAIVVKKDPLEYVEKLKFFKNNNISELINE